MIKVINPGFYSTIQDKGRFGYQHYGVPYSGVMDTYASVVANMLLGNDEHAAVMEMTMTGPTLHFEEKTIICLSGAEMSPTLNGKSIEANKAVFVAKNDTLAVGKLGSGFRGYLAVAGGFKTAMGMESRSMFQGITKQCVLAKGDMLPIQCRIEVLLDKNASIRFNNKYLSSGIIEVFKGPEFDKLSSREQELLTMRKFRVSKKHNRMAYQLEGYVKNNLEPIITSLVLPGTVQLTPSGELIVLMRDCQTTGGYPRVLQLNESAMNIMAQKFTGNEIYFKLI